MFVCVLVHVRVCARACVLTLYACGGYVCVRFSASVHVMLLTYIYVTLLLLGLYPRA